MDMKTTTNSAVLFLFLFLVSPCYADEVFLRDREQALSGTVLKEDEGSVTIRIPKEAVRSIVRNGVRTLAEEDISLKGETKRESEADLNEKVEQLQRRIERLESNLEKLEEKDASSAPAVSKQGAVTEQLLREEMGRVEGTILWQEKPLDRKEVKIVLTRYTGFSLSSLKKMYARDRENSSDQEISFVTKSDAQGRYHFENVPPGQYRLHWRPGSDMDWVHRMREKPDFEVFSGKLTIQNIPDKQQ